MGVAGIKDQNLIHRAQKLTQICVQETPLFWTQDICFPLSTKDCWIVDAKGRRVKLAGGNWSGAHMCRHCVDGLECRPLRDIALDIRNKCQMNCIRLTYSLQLFYDNKIVPDEYLTANPQLRGRTAIQIFDFTVEVLTSVGLMVILNNHTSTSQWCCSNEDGDGLWWSYKYPECLFFQCTEQLARRYAHNPRVIGLDLRNEIRKANGFTPTWGDNNPLTDWKRAAKISGEKALKIAPHWLIFVSGLNYQLDLTGIYDSPLTYSVPNKLVYTGHFYGFSWPIVWATTSYESFKDRLLRSQTFVRGLGVPYFLGEFGNNTRDTPWQYLIRYLKETDIDWTYWALDGFKCHPADDETFGVFTNCFGGPRHPEMLQDMISVGPPASKPLQKKQFISNSLFKPTSTLSSNSYFLPSINPISIKHQNISSLYINQPSKIASQLQPHFQSASISFLQRQQQNKNFGIQSQKPQLTKINSLSNIQIGTKKSPFFYPKPPL